MNNVSTSNSLPVPVVRRGRGRRPSAQVRSGVLKAAADLLFTQGLAAVTFDRVASAAGSSRTTLYKWWPTPAALAAEAFFARVDHALDFPDTGDIVSDIHTQLNAFTHLMQYEDAGRVIREIIGGVQMDPALRHAFTAAYARPRREEVIRAFQRAQDRGQLDKGAPLDVLVDQIWGACYYRILILDEHIDEPLAHRLISNALSGLLLPPIAPEPRAEPAE